MAQSKNMKLKIQIAFSLNPTATKASFFQPLAEKPAPQKLQENVSRLLSKPKPDTSMHVYIMAELPIMTSIQR